METEELEINWRLNEAQDWQNTPYAILERYAQALNKQSDGLLNGRIVYTKSSSDYPDYSCVYSFIVDVLPIRGYSVEIIDVLLSQINKFPVKVLYQNLGIKTYYTKTVHINKADEFIVALNDITKSNSINELMNNLYSQAKASDTINRNQKTGKYKE